MDARQINLLGEKQPLSVREVRLHRTLKKIAPILLGIYAVMVLAVFGTSWYLNAQLKRVSTAIEMERSAIKGNELNEGVYLLFLQKIRALRQIMALRPPYVQTFAYLKQFESDEIQIKTFSIDDKGEILLSLAVTNSELLEQLVDSILEEGLQTFETAELRSVISTLSGYDITFAFRLANVNQL